MRKVQRSELMDLGSYEQVRERFVQRMIELKKHRRVHVGDHMTFIFENRETMLFQIQEMLRTERITQEKGIEHELETYNTMVPGDGELFATFMIEYDDRDERRRMLDSLVGIKEHLFLEVGDKRVGAEFEVLPGEAADRVPAVNYIRFTVGTDAAAILRDRNQSCALEVTHPAYTARTELGEGTRQQLADDLDEP